MKPRERGLAGGRSHPKVGDREKRPCALIEPQVGGRGRFCFLGFKNFFYS